MNPRQFQLMDIIQRAPGTRLDKWLRGALSSAADSIAQATRLLIMPSALTHCVKRTEHPEIWLNEPTAAAPPNSLYWIEPAADFWINDPQMRFGILAKFERNRLTFSFIVADLRREACRMAYHNWGWTEPFVPAPTLTSLVIDCAETPREEWLELTGYLGRLNLRRDKRRDIGDALAEIYEPQTEREILIFNDLKSRLAFGESDIKYGKIPPEPEDYYYPSTSEHDAIVLANGLFALNLFCLINRPQIVRVVAADRESAQHSARAHGKPRPYSADRLDIINLIEADRDFESKRSGNAMPKRQHTVDEHDRHYPWGLTIRVPKHKRGNPLLGFVEHREPTDFRVISKIPPGTRRATP